MNPMRRSRIFSTPPVSRLKRIIPESTSLTKSLIVRFTRYNPSNCLTAAAKTNSNLFRPVQTCSNLIKVKNLSKYPKVINFKTHSSSRLPPTFMLRPLGIAGIP